VDEHRWTVGDHRRLALTTTTLIRRSFRGSTAHDTTSLPRYCMSYIDAVRASNRGQNCLAGFDSRPAPLRSREQAPHRVDALVGRSEPAPILVVGVSVARDFEPLPGTVRVYHERCSSH
jgi:hypothetical protein